MGRSCKPDDKCHHLTVDIPRLYQFPYRGTNPRAPRKRTFRQESEIPMRTSVRTAGVLAAAAACLSIALPAGSASAAPMGDAPKPAKPAPPPTGRIVICNHSGYMFDVYADGPSIREDDLAGSFDECTDW